MNTDLTRELIQLAQNKRWRGGADVWERGTQNSKFIFSLPTKRHTKDYGHICVIQFLHIITFVLHITPTRIFYPRDGISSSYSQNEKLTLLGWGNYWKL